MNIFFSLQMKCFISKRGKKDAWNSFREVSPPPCPYGTEMKSVVLRGLIIIGKKSKNNLIYILKLKVFTMYKLEQLRMKALKQIIQLNATAKKIFFLIYYVYFNTLEVTKMYT